MKKWYEPIYRKEIKFSKCQEKLLDTPYLKKLAHIFHTGVFAFISPLRHTRLEHSLGLLTLCRIFDLGEEYELAALLHDIGHISFSHSAEKAVKDLDHHKLTEAILLKSEISSVLKNFRFKPTKILKLINSWPFEIKRNLLNLDHFDAFLRDTYYMGIQKLSPSEIIKEISIENEKISINNLEAANEMMRLIIEDNKIMAETSDIIGNILLSELFKHGIKEKILTKNFLLKATEYEVISLFLQQEKKEIKELIQDIIYSNFKKYGVKKAKTGYKLKLYFDTFFCKGKEILEINKNFKQKFRELKLKEGHYRLFRKRTK